MIAMSRWDLKARGSCARCEEQEEGGEGVMKKEEWFNYSLKLINNELMMKKEKAQRLGGRVPSAKWCLTFTCSRHQKWKRTEDSWGKDKWHEPTQEWMYSAHKYVGPSVQLRETD